MAKWDKYLSEVKLLHSKTSTYSNYKMALSKFNSGTKEEVLEYISSSPDSDSTKTWRLRVLKGALIYLGEYTPDVKRVISSFRPDTVVQPCPSQADIEIIWNSLDDERDRLMFCLMTYMGLRVGEVYRLNLSDINEDSLILRKTKGHKADILPIVHDRVKSSLRAYLAVRINSDEEALFTTKFGRMGLPTIKGKFRKIFDKVGMEKYHCHSLRRFFANSMYAAGIPLADMQINMRHSSPNTTMNYINITQQDKVRVMKKTWNEGKEA